jgi:hypothetical protein
VWLVFFNFIAFGMSMNDKPLHTQEDGAQSGY